MDRECVSLLPSVCAVLADSGKSLPDDTSLEKLLDWFTGLTKPGGSLLETCPCLLEFVSSVVKDTGADPGVLSFTLKLTGLMASTEAGFRTLQECSLLGLVFNLQRWQEAGLWADPCLRIGWIQGLMNCLRHPKALGFFVQSEFIEPLLKLQTDPSLFVGSAANQMLAHLLLFFQPGPLTSRNGTDKTEKDEHISACEHPAHPEYPTAVRLITEHIQQTLVPKENTPVRQSVQTLRLSALLLARAGPPLRDKLLHTAAPALDELTTAGHSQLTQPLMEVILAAYSSSASADQRVSSLLAAMLNTNRAADLVHAAAAFLLRARHLDTVHTFQAVTIMLLPLHIITGKTLLDTTNTSVNEHQSTIEEHLKSKTSCISLICVCLTNTPQITLMPAAVLPCPPCLMVGSVLSLLRTCVVGCSSSSAASNHLISSSKVQRCALQALEALSGSPGAKEKISEVFSVLHQYLDNPDSEPTVLHKSYQALVKWMSVCTDLGFITDQIRQDVLEVVKKRACDMRWEVRDSTVEFLGQLASVRVFLKPDQVIRSGQSDAFEARGASEALLGGCCCTTPLLKEALQDTESYVRASAISALAKTLTHSWQQGAAHTQEEAEIVSQLLEMLSHDSEGFARRAVVRYFISWFSHASPSWRPTSLLMPCVRSVLSHSDLDWEVKVHTLELAQLLMEDVCSGGPGHREEPETVEAYGVVSEKTSTLHKHTGTGMEALESHLVVQLKDLVQQGVLSALLCGLVDCDRPVAFKACGLLLTLRKTLGSNSEVAKVSEVSFELPGYGWGREIMKILGKVAVNEAQKSLNGGQEEGEEGGVTVKVCDVLRGLGLDERLDLLTQSSDHVHNSSLSLLQDILSARVTHTKPDAGEEVIVDCY